jgi:hypothetical protein
MTTQELKQYIDKVLGNNIRCLLPSYWWKKLFYNVVDNTETLIGLNGISIVDEETDLQGIDAQNGKIASVRTSWRSFSECYLPNDWQHEIHLCAKIDAIKVSNIVLDIDDATSLSGYLVLTNYGHNPIQNLIAIGIKEGNLEYITQSLVGGESTHTILRSLSSGEIYDSAVKQLNSFLSKSGYRFIGYEVLSEFQEEFQELINRLVTWSSNDARVFVKGVDNWNALAELNDIPKAEYSLDVVVDDKMSTSSVNPVQNKVVTEYIDELTKTVGDASILYSNSQNISLETGKGYIVDSSGKPAPANNIVIGKIDGLGQGREKILFFEGATSLSLPNNVMWENGVVPEIDPNATYCLTIKDYKGVNGIVFLATLQKFLPSAQL